MCVAIAEEFQDGTYFDGVLPFTHNFQASNGSTFFGGCYQRVSTEIPDPVGP